MACVLLLEALTHGASQLGMAEGSKKAQGACKLWVNTRPFVF
jgi:hypothetical protein